ncbi:GPI transamidase component Gpi16p [Diutina catenulata]
MLAQYTALLVWAAVATCHRFYNESLSLTPLPRNRMMASFQFDILSGPLTHHGEAEHYTYFPKALGPVLETTNARELHLRFTQGWWDDDNWGRLPYDGAKSGGTGVEMWAVVEARDVAAAKEQWFRLTTQLSGFFCASLNFIDDAITTMPKHVVGEGEAPLMDPRNQLFLLKAALPSEPICTENLTPFLKLLPTRGKAGVASLLDGHSLFDSLWHGMSIDVTTACASDQCALQMVQTVNAVVDVKRSVRKQNEGSIPKPVPGDQLRCDESKKHDIWTCFPLTDAAESRYSLHTVFGKHILGPAFADGDKTTSQVAIHVDPAAWSVRVVDEANSTTVYSDNAHIRHYIESSLPQDIVFEASNHRQVAPVASAPVRVSRSLTGYSQDKGGIRVSFANQRDRPTRFVYSETLPWFMRLHMHTLRFSGSSRTPMGKGGVKEWVLDQFYVPAVDRKRPSRLEYVIELPPRAELTLSFNFAKNLLLIHEYPPDANHGFAIDPAVIKVIRDDDTTEYELRTTSLLLTLPVPDFSMPYNVIILTCTVMSLAYGSIFNLLIKKVVTEDEYQEAAAKSNVGKLKRKLRALKSAIKGN